MAGLTVRVHSLSPEGEELGGLVKVALRVGLGWAVLRCSDSSVGPWGRLVLLY